MFNLKALCFLIVFMIISLNAQTSEHLDNNVSSSAALTFFSFKGGETNPIFENLPHKTCILLSMVNHAGEDFLTRTKISSRKQFSKLASYFHTHFGDFFCNPQKFKDNQEILDYISTAFKVPYIFNLSLYFDLATSNYDELFIKASKNIENIPLKILLELNGIAYSKRDYAYLQSRAGQGDQHAQRYLNEAAYSGKLGFATKTREERQKYLQERADQGDQSAQGYLNRVAYRGGAGFATKTREERQKYLQERADRGDQDAQRYLNRAAYGGQLGFATKTPEERRKYLQERADQGDQHAQGYLNEAADEGGLGFATKTPEERQKYLQERGGQGDQSAQRYLNRAAYGGQLGFATKTPEERVKYLQERADRGDQGAQGYLNLAVYNGALGFATKTSEERVTYLQEQAYKGDQEAQKYLCKVYNKTFGDRLLTGVFYGYVMGIYR